MFLLKLLLVVAVQGMEVQEANSGLLSESVQNDVWLAELEVTEVQERKIRFWWKKQASGLEKVRSYQRDAWGESRERAAELREKAAELRETIVNQDGKKLRKILTSSQLIRANQLWNWSKHRKRYTKSVVNTLCTSPTYQTLMLDIDELATLRAELHREEADLEDAYKNEVRQILESLISREEYDRIHSRDYTGLKLSGPLESVSTLNFLAAEFQGPDDKLLKIKELSKSVRNRVKIQREISPELEQKELEKTAMVGVFEQLDELVIEMKFERLSAWFGRKSLEDMGNGRWPNLDAQKYLRLSSDQLGQTMEEIAKCNHGMNVRYAAMQLRHYERLVAVISPESQELLESLFGPPPVSMLWYHYDLGRETFLNATPDNS